MSAPASASLSPSRWRRHWQLLLLLLGILLPLLLVMDLTEDVFRDGGFVWDHSILAWYRAHRTPALNQLAEDLGVVAGPKVLPVITLVLALWQGWRVRMRGWFLVLSVAGATLLNVLAKVIFQRPRPDELGAVLIEPGYSFPSGHTMVNAALGIALAYLFFSPRQRQFWPLGVLALLWAVLVGASRNYLGVHYPTDVLVGFLSSLVWVSGLRLVILRRDRQHLAPSIPVKSLTVSPETGDAEPVPTEPLPVETVAHQKR